MLSRVASLLSVSLVVASSMAMAQLAPRAGSSTPLRVEPELNWSTAPDPAPKAGSKASRVPTITLPAPTQAEISRHIAPAAKAAPVKIGFPRAVPALRNEAETSRRLQFETLLDEAAAGLTVTSRGASAVRMGLRIASLPHTATLRFSGPGDATAFEVTGAEVHRAIARNLEARASDIEARTYWSPIVEGDTITLEIVLAAGADARDVRISAPLVSHLVGSARNDFSIPKFAAACEVDAVCHEAAWGSEMRAVARLVFTRDGASYLCSGTLLADRDSATQVPYFLTANHCISSQATASSIQTYWFYRSTACNSGIRGDYRTVAGGATLLNARSATDSSLLRLNATPPAGAVFSGWTVGSVPALGTSVAGIHHPTGDLQKISFGRLDGYYTCGEVADGEFECTSAATSSSTFYAAAWQSGITESGSSGSPLFVENGRYLVGQLYGGTTACANPGHDFYGRFDVAYNAALSHWLGVTATPGTPSFSPAENYSDLWWNPNESGWGLSLTQHGATLFAAWYVYDDRGRATWLVMPGGRWTSATAYTGDLYATTGPDARMPFDPSRVTRSRVGTATLSFSSRDRGVLTYQVNGVSGTKQIQRQLFGPADPVPVANYGDLWWNAAESGWGLSITQQYRSLFAVWYSYAPDGSPAWYVMPSGTWSSADTYGGTLYRTSAAPGAFLSGSFSPGSVALEPVGTLTLRFAGTTSATMTYSVDGVSGSKSITRQPF